MAIDRTFARRELMLAGAVLGATWVAGGCGSLDEEDDPFASSLRFDDPGLHMGFHTMYGLVSPEDRAVLDNEIVWRKDLRIHFLRHKLPKGRSRGAACAPHSEAVKWGWCAEDRHPDAIGIRNLRNWDLVWDEDLAEEWENGTYSQIDAMFYHELFGHIVRVLRGPKVMRCIAHNKPLFNIFEDEARAIENQYRRYRGYPIVPAVLPRKPGDE